MPHQDKGQPAHSYRPSATRRPSKLSPIREERLLPRVNSTPSRRKMTANNLGLNYGPSNILSLLTRKSNYKVTNNVPSLGVARNRQAVQEVINKARAKYQNAKTNAARIKVYSQFTKNHAAAMNALKRKHLKNLEELNSMLAGSPSKQLTKSLQGAVNALKANLRKR